MSRKSRRLKANAAKAKTTPPSQRLPTEIILEITDRAIDAELCHFHPGALIIEHADKLQRHLRQVYSIARVNVACKLQAAKLLDRQKQNLRRKELELTQQYKSWSKARPKFTLEDFYVALSIRRSFRSQMEYARWQRQRVTRSLDILRLEKH